MRFEIHSQLAGGFWGDVLVTRHLMLTDERYRYRFTVTLLKVSAGIGGADGPICC